jgi:hypothetical protein
VVDEDTGRPKGLAFLIFKRSESAQRAVEHGEHRLGKQKMRANYYQFKKDKKYWRFDIEEEQSRQNVEDSLWLARGFETQDNLGTGAGGTTMPHGQSFDFEVTIANHSNEDRVLQSVTVQPYRAELKLTSNLPLSGGHKSVNGKTAAGSHRNHPCGKVISTGRRKHKVDMKFVPGPRTRGTTYRQCYHATPMAL